MGLGVGIKGTGPWWIGMAEAGKRKLSSSTFSGVCQLSSNPFIPSPGCARMQPFKSPLLAPRLESQERWCFFVDGICPRQFLSFVSQASGWHVGRTRRITAPSRCPG
jgi:hypothetical protein